MKVLVIEADRCQYVSDLASALHLGWEQVEMLSTSVANLEPAVLSATQPDIIVTVAAPNTTTWMADIRQIRPHTDAVIVVLAVEHSDADLIEAVECGADEYLPLPLQLATFVAKMRAALRRVKGLSYLKSQPVICGDLELDPETHEARLGGELLPLTPMEFRILLRMAQRSGKVSSREHLTGEIGHEEQALDGAALRKHIQHLRRKLDCIPGGNAAIVTIPGVGHKLVVEQANPLDMTSTA